MISKVNIVDVISPPIMTHAILERVSAPSAKASAVGSIPTIIVIVVMKIDSKTENYTAVVVNLMNGYDSF